MRRGRGCERIIQNGESMVEIKEFWPSNAVKVSTIKIVPAFNEDLQADPIKGFCTSKDRFINNSRVRYKDLRDKKAHSDLAAELRAKADFIVRTGFNPAYNCHGMTFASRRTWITCNESIQHILEDDDYTVVPENEAMPGDIVIYMRDSIFWHSGVVVEQAKPQLVLAGGPLFAVPRVVSKWGKSSEVIHLANVGGDYHDCERVYYRVVPGGKL